MTPFIDIDCVEHRIHARKHPSNIVIDEHDERHAITSDIIRTTEETRWPKVESVLIDHTAIKASEHCSSESFIFE